MSKKIVNGLLVSYFTPTCASEGIKKFDASMSKFHQSLGVGIWCTLCICDVGYRSPSFVINVVILERSIFKPQKLALFQKYFSPTFFTPNEMEQIAL